MHENVCCYIYTQVTWACARVYMPSPISQLRIKLYHGFLVGQFSSAGFTFGCYPNLGCRYIREKLQHNDTRSFAHHL